MDSATTRWFVRLLLVQFVKQRTRQLGQQASARATVTLFGCVGRDTENQRRIRQLDLLDAQHDEYVAIDVGERLDRS